MKKEKMIVITKAGCGSECPGDCNVCPILHYPGVIDQYSIYAE